MFILQVNRLLGEYGRGGPSSARLAARTIKPEAEDNAERNKGVMSDLMGRYGQLQVIIMLGNRLTHTVSLHALIGRDDS